MHFAPIRRSFYSGLLLLAPVGVTLIVIQFLVEKIGEPLGRAIKPLLPENVLGLPYFEGLLSFASLFLALILVTLFGWFSRQLVGRFLVQVFERIVSQVPFVKNVYSTVKQIVQTFSEQNKAIFQECVMVEFPHKGKWVLGFLTGEGRGEVQEKTDEQLLFVFIPTTPNPTSGYLILVPATDIIHLEMSIPDGMKVIISGGAVVPPYPYPPKPIEGQGNNRNQKIKTETPAEDG